MARAFLAQLVFLIAITARAQVYVWTNQYGDVQYSQDAMDAQRFAVGGVVTLATMPEVAFAPIDPVQSPPIEVPYLVIQDVDGGAAYGIYVDDGDIIGGILDHASPRDPEAIKVRLQAERQERRELRQDVRTVRTNMVALSTTTNTAAAQAQQIEQLRKAVRDLSAAILKMTKDTAP